MELENVSPAQSSSSLRLRFSLSLVVVQLVAKETSKQHLPPLASRIIHQVQKGGNQTMKRGQHPSTPNMTKKSHHEHEAREPPLELIEFLKCGSAFPTIELRTWHRSTPPAASRMSTWPPTVGQPRVRADLCSKLTHQASEEPLGATISTSTRFLHSSFRPFFNLNMCL